MRSWNMSRVAFCVMAALLLVLPAVADEIDGTWNMAIDTGDEIREFPITIESDGEAVTAKVAEDVIKGTFSGGVLKLEGKVYSAQEGYSATMKLSGKLDASQLSGGIIWDTYDVTFTATKAD